MDESVFTADLLERLIHAQRVVVLTGAGISAESGVPTFRSADGIWSRFKPEELASMDAFMRNPDRVWEWYDYRRRLIREVQPNPGHATLAKMEAYYPHFSLFTQNVDGLHSKAGSRVIHELHGNIMRNRCTQCNAVSYDFSDHPATSLPTCECGGRLRPDVVWFGESLPEEVLQSAWDEATRAEVYFSIGTSAVVYPAAHLPVLAAESGAFVIEINPERTPISHLISLSLQGRSGEVLPSLWQKMQQSGNF